MYYKILSIVDESSTSEAALPDSSTGVDRQQMAPIITPTSTPSQQPQQHSNNHQAAIQEMMMKALQLQVINNNNNNNSSSAASANISQGQRDTKVTVQAELMTTENEVSLCPYVLSFWNIMLVICFDITINRLVCPLNSWEGITLIVS